MFQFWNHWYQLDTSKITYSPSSDSLTYFWQWKSNKSEDVLYVTILHDKTLQQKLCKFDLFHQNMYKNECNILISHYSAMTDPLVIS